jgi:surface protein
MSGMFEESEFNGDISKWDVSKVADMWKMFYKSKFNGDLSNWNMENVEYTTIMFSKSNFTGENGDISKWKFKKLISAYGMFDPEKLSENDDLLDKAIDAWNLPDDIVDAMY